MWVAGGEEGAVARVDPDGPRAVERFDDREQPGGDRASPAARCGPRRMPRSAAHRGGTLRVSLPHAPGAAIVLDWLHWLAYTTSATAQLDSLAYDGLVAYRRVEGPAGAHARRRARHDGADAERRRQDLRLHVAAGAALLRREARPARPTSGPRWSASWWPAATGRRRTASRGCLRGHRRRAAVHAAGGRRATSSRGIETDVRGAHDHHPPDPPGRRISCTSSTMHFAYVVPADSAGPAHEGPDAPGYRAVSRRRVGRRSAAGRSSATATSGLIPARSRGEGFADRIEVRLHGKRTIERQIAAVQRGDADVAVVADPFGTAGLGGTHRARWWRSSPGQVHSAPAPTTDWMFLNVRRRPFDDLRVRRALNFAIDRAKVVELSGGPEVGRADLPDRAGGFPGNAPVLPVHGRARGRRVAGPRPTWTQARRLVAASGRAGERVVVRGAGLPRGGRPVFAQAARRARLPDDACGCWSFNDSRA